LRHRECTTPSLNGSRADTKVGDATSLKS